MAARQMIRAGDAPRRAGLIDRMTQVQLRSSTLNTMMYYGDGKRQRYQDTTGALDRSFLWDGENIVRQLEPDGSTDRRYTLKPAGHGERV